jgi:hypothetical protein
LHAGDKSDRTRGDAESIEVTITSKSKRIIMKVIGVITFGLLVALSQGCTATHVGDEKASPDGRFAVFVKVRGAYGRPYGDESNKKVSITITGEGAPEVRGFVKQFTLRGGAVGWNEVWDEKGNLVLLL